MAEDHRDAVLEAVLAWPPHTMSGERQQFEIVLKGRLGPAITEAFRGFQIVAQDSKETRLRGWVADQSALHGVLERLRALGIELTSVQQVNESP